MRVITFGVLLIATAAPGYATDCSSIIAATTAEIRAGETLWDERAESLVRRAAGAACVKALTKFEAAETPAQHADETTAEAVADETANPSNQDDGDAGWKFLGFDVNSVQGSPSQKPYERKR